jgi:hypothetical protein
LADKNFGEDGRTFYGRKKKISFREEEEEEREGKQKENCKDELKQKFIVGAEEGEK